MIGFPNKTTKKSLYDTVSKYLIENHTQDFALWLLGKPCTLNRLEPSELSLEPIRADALILADADQILHIEMQTIPKPDIPFRLLDYRIRLYRKFPNKQVKQVVIYLKPTNSNLAHQTTFEILGTIHNFEVIRLWEQPTSLFLKTLGLLPLAVLSNTPDRSETLRQAAEIINQVKDPKSQNTISAVTAILAGLLLDKEIISRLLRRDTMQESVIYQEILEEGIEKGRQEGRQEGIIESKIIIAKNLLSLGISLEQVATATGLSLEEVEKL